MTGQSDQPSTRVAVVDDHPLVAQGVATLLQREGVTATVITPDQSDTVVDTITSLEPDLAVLDLHLPITGGGLGLIEPLAGTCSVVVLTGSTDRAEWARCVEAGARAVLSKAEPLDDIVRQLHLLAKGHDVKPNQRAELARHAEAARADQDVWQRLSSLSRRERTVLAGLMEGLTPIELADRDSVSVGTVRSQVKSVLGKLGVHSQLTAVAMAHRVSWQG